MSVKIRLARRGRKKLAMYDVVIADARAPRDGRFIEKIGTYDPNVNPAIINIISQIIPFIRKNEKLPITKYFFNLFFKNFFPISLFTVNYSPY